MTKEQAREKFDKLPCWIGDIAYRIPEEEEFKNNLLFPETQENNRIYAEKVISVCFNDFEIYYVCENLYHCVQLNFMFRFGKSWFATREEAQAKLTELEEKYGVVK